MGRSKESGLQVLPLLDVRIRRDRLRGHLGYPPDAAVSPAILERIEREVDACLPLIRPAGMYRIFDVRSLEARRVALEGGISFRGSVREYLGEIDRLAVFIATAGDAIYRRAQEKIAGGRTLEGMVANAVGSEAADGATEAIIGRIGEEAAAGGRVTTLPYSPGYCGMDIEEQAAVFAALDGARIGVRLLPSFLMTPIKSVSGIIGMGASPGVVSRGSPCERCDRQDCMMRRYA